MNRLVLWLSITLLLAASRQTGAAESFASRDEVVEAANASTPKAIEDSIDVLERLFAGGNYEQTIRLAAALLDNPYFSPLPPIQRGGVDYALLASEVVTDLDARFTYLMAERATRQLKREMIRLFHARAQYEKSALANNRTGVRAAIEEFERLAANSYRFSAPQYQAESAYWVGRGYVFLGEYNSAVTALRRVSVYNPVPELDVRSCLLLADALKALADIVGTRGEDRPGRSPQDIPENPAEVLKTRAALLRDAERELSKITTNHPQSRHNPETELRLIELRFELKEYEEAQRLATEFMRRATPGTENYARAAYYQANSVYLEGRIAEASDLFRIALEENKDASAAIRADLFYGYGWTNARLAQSSSPEHRLVNLTRAQAALTQAVRLMPFGTRRQRAIMELVPVLIDLELYNDALTFLQEVLGEPDMRARANYLSGRAAVGAGMPEEATRFFHAVLEISRGGGGSLLELEALMALAELENGRGFYAESYAYYEQAQQAALTRRQFDSLAQASLGMAIAVAELGYPDDDKRTLAARRLGDTLLAATLSPEPGARDIGTVTQMIALRTTALAEWNNAGAHNLDKADAMLQRLRGRLLPRLREDELKYVQGKVYYLKAQTLLRESPVAYNVTLAQYDDIFDILRMAENILLTSLQANPRGSVSPRTRYLLGQVYTTYADLKMALAAHLRGRGMGAEAVQLEEDGVTYYQHALAPLGLAITDSDRDGGLRMEARNLLGKTYLALGDYASEPAMYERGLDEFRILVSEPTIPWTRKIAALRDMATALSQKRRKAEAVELLMPYVDKDILSALKAGEILIELRQPRRAYETMVAGISAATGRENTPRLDLARTVYTAHVLGLNSAADIVRSPADIPAQEAVSADALLRLSADYPGTAWASMALLDLGRWLLDLGRWQEAVDKAAAGIEALRQDLRAVDTVQALYLLAGRGYMEGGRSGENPELLRKAQEMFAQAERAATRSDLGRQQRAAAIREQGNAALALGNADEALRFYGRVFSIFFNEYEQADLARIAAAQIHAGRGNYRLALDILDQGFDQEMLMQYKLLYRQKLGLEGGGA